MRATLWYLEAWSEVVFGHILSLSHLAHTPLFVGPELNRITSATHVLRFSSLWLAGSCDLAAGSPAILAAGLAPSEGLTLPVLGKEEGRCALLCHYCRHHLEALKTTRRS